VLAVRLKRKVQKVIKRKETLNKTNRLTGEVFFVLLLGTLFKINSSSSKIFSNAILIIPKIDKV
jgi:hypothetical protein